VNGLIVSAEMAADDGGAETPVSGEDLRRSFEHKLDEREPHEQPGV